MWHVYVYDVPCKLHVGSLSNPCRTHKHFINLIDCFQKSNLWQETFGLLWNALSIARPSPPLGSIQGTQSRGRPCEMELPPWPSCLGDVGSDAWPTGRCCRNTSKIDACDLDLVDTSHLWWKDSGPGCQGTEVPAHHMEETVHSASLSHHRPSKTHFLLKPIDFMSCSEQPFMASVIAASSTTAFSQSLIKRVFFIDWTSRSSLSVYSRHCSTMPIATGLLARVPLAVFSMIRTHKCSMLSRENCSQAIALVKLLAICFISKPQSDTLMARQGLTVTSMKSWNSEL